MFRLDASGCLGSIINKSSSGLDIHTLLLSSTLINLPIDPTSIYYLLLVENFILVVPVCLDANNCFSFMEYNLVEYIYITFILCANQFANRPYIYLLFLQGLLKLNKYLSLMT